MSSSPRGRGGGSNNPPRRGGSSTPPAASQPPVDRNYIRHQLQVLAWIRVGLGAVAGMLAGFLPFAPYGTFNSNSYAEIYFAVFIYVGSYYLAKYVLDIPLPHKDRNKLITQGIGGYIMMFLFFWILYATYCYGVSGTCPHILL
jgi:hypothetical protein